MAKEITTICLIRRNNNILLAMKKRGFGVNRWNGYGGKVRSGESIEQSAKRECQEEAEIKDIDLALRGIIDFTVDEPPADIECYIFAVTRYQGEPNETEEMAPRWFPINAIPYDQMWPADRYWYPIFLQDQFFHMKVSYENHDKLIGQPVLTVFTTLDQLQAFTQNYSH